MPAWLLLSLVTLVLLGVGQIFVKRGYDAFSPLWSATIDAVFSMVIYVPIVLLLGVSFHISLVSFLFILLVALLYTFYYYAIEKGQISLSGTVFASYPLVTIFFAHFFLHEHVTLLQLLMVVLILCGGVVLSYEKGTFTKISHLKKKEWILWALLGAVATGFGDFVAKGTLNSLVVNTYIFYFALAFPLSVVFYWILDKKGRRLPKIKNFSALKFTFIGSLFMSLNLLTFVYALSFGEASLVSTITSGYIALTVILAYFFLKEKLSLQQLVGIILICIGVAFIGV